MSARSSSSTPQIRFRSGDAALRQQFEIVDQPRHRRIVAVGGLGLQREAFGERCARRPRPGRGPGRCASACSTSSTRRAGGLGDVAERRRSDSRFRRASRRSAGQARRRGPARHAAGRADARPASRPNIRRGRSRTPSSPPPDSRRRRRSCRSRALRVVQSMSSGRSSSAWPMISSSAPGSSGASSPSRRSSPRNRRRRRRSPSSLATALRAAGSSTFPRR